MSGDKPLLVIPDEFVQHVLHLITDETDAIVSVVEAAQQEYKKPMDSWVTGWFYLYSRTRVNDVVSTIDLMHKHHDAYACVKAFRDLVTKGEWNVGSFNVTLFRELIKRIPGYQALEEQNVRSYILRLKELIAPKIDAYIVDYEVNQRAIKLREEQEHAVQKRLEQLIDNVLIFDALDDAKKAAQCEPRKEIFCFVKNNKYKPYLIDVMGKECALDIHPLFIQKFAAITDAASSDDLRSLKLVCIKAKEQLLANVQLMVNPEDEHTKSALTNEELIAKRRFPAFILRHTSEQSRLCWITSLGKVKEISLENYLQLKEWLSLQPTQLNDEAILQLKTYLLHVDPMSDLDKDRLKAFNSLLFKVPEEQVEATPSQPSKVVKSTNANSLVGGAFRSTLEQIMLRNVQSKTTPVPKLPVEISEELVITPKSQPVEACKAPAKISVLQPEKATSLRPKKLTPDRYANLNKIFGVWDTKVKEAENEAKLDIFLRTVLA